MSTQIGFNNLVSFSLLWELKFYCWYLSSSSCCFMMTPFTRSKHFHLFMLHVCSLMWRYTVCHLHCFLLEFPCATEAFSGRSQRTEEVVFPQDTSADAFKDMLLDRSRVWAWTVAYKERLLPLSPQRNTSTAGTLESKQHKLAKDQFTSPQTHSNSWPLKESPL